MTVTIIETAMLTVKAGARELIDIMYTILLLLRKSVFTRIGSLMLPAIFPQATVCVANMHALSIGTSVQVTLVWLVVVGQLPQFDARML